jgi:PST family polysaccharide transporter
MKSLLLKNISYIGLSQAANYLLPLITLPYISRVVGVQNFGALEYAYIIALYFVQAVEYSFDVSATRRMAAISKRTSMVSRLFSAVLFAKIILWITSSIIFVILIQWIDAFSEYKTIIMIYYCLTISSVFTQNWFFQGLQKLKIIALANVSIKLIFTALLFILVREEKDYIWIALSTALGYLIVSGATFSYSFKIFPGLQIIPPRLKSITIILKKGFYIFVSGMANKLYTFSGMYWAGNLLTTFDLGIFGAAHKLFIVVQTMMFYPINLALLPHLAKKLKEGRDKYIDSLKNYAKTVSIIYIPSMLILYLITPYLVQILFGTEFSDSKQIFRFFIPSLTAGVFINLFMSQGLISIHKDALFLRITLLFSVISMIGNYFFILHFVAQGGALFRSLMDIFFAIVSGFVFYYAMRQLKTQSV